MSAVDEALRQLVLKRMPGGRTISFRTEDGKIRRGILYQTREPFQPREQELKTPGWKNLQNPDPYHG